MSLDHIVHVGYHKTGSTWLQRAVFPTVHGAVNVARHPLITALFSNLVMDHQFMAETFRSAIREFEDDRLLFSYENLVDSPWPEGSDSPPAAQRPERLASVLPGARIIIVVRDPSTLTKSLYAQYIQVGGYFSRDDFEQYVLSSEYLNFEAGIARYRALFDNVLVLPYELMNRDRITFLGRIESFADVRFSAPQRTRRENPSLSGWRIPVLRAWNRLFRLSRFNPDPALPIPQAAAMRHILQLTQR